MQRLLIALGFVLTACASAPGAANTPVPFTSAAPAEAPLAATATWQGVDLPAGEYRLDPHHASVNFRIRHEGLAWFTGRFNTVDATIAFDPVDPTKSQLSAQIDANSVDAGVTRAFDHQIAQALGAEASPQITFTSTSFTRTGEYAAQMTGDLTMNGQTHPATLEVTYDGGHTDPLRGAVVLGFSAHATIDRSQWGMRQWSMFVGDNVQLVIEAEFVKA
jgi:polyisoprenoid-binding protein YceI